MKILIHGRAFPVAMWRWFDWALRDLGHDVKSVGCYYKDYIPWNGGMRVGYDFPPDIEIPEIPFYPLQKVLDQLDDWKPELIIQASDVTHLSGKAPCPNYLIKTDPHAVDYSKRLENIDQVFSMQDTYKADGDIWLPYAYAKGIHKYVNLNQEYDVVFSGLQYDHRAKALKAMEGAGLKVYSALGTVYDEYVETYNKGGIAFNWSSQNDLPARFWEGLAMRRMVLTNKVPDMELLELKDGVHFVTFDSVEDAVDKAKYYSEHTKERDAIAYRGWKAVKPHNYHNRIKTIL